MDNNAQVYSVPQPMAQPAQSTQPTQPVQSAQPVQPDANPKKNLGILIALVAVSVVALVFAGLFIWMLTKYQSASTNLESQIKIASADAVAEQTKKLEAEFLEREKNPFKTFAGPADYGQLSFEYPKTWSLYVAKDAIKGGDYEAYFNPNQVDAVSKTTINALRVIIRNDSYDTVLAEYQKALEKKDSGLTAANITFNNINGTKYSGTIPGTDLNGYIVIFKIRDKAVILQTDSVLFESDFNTLLETITFNS